MPIRPENKSRYPSDWDEISLRIREEAGQKCEWCQKPNGQMIRVLPGGKWLDPNAKWWRDNRGWRICSDRQPAVTEGREIKIILTVAHLNHKPEDCRRENLRALCQACHLAYDAPHKAEQRRKRLREAKKESQPELFDE